MDRQRDRVPWREDKDGDGGKKEKRAEMEIYIYIYTGWYRNLWRRGDQSRFSVSGSR